MSARSTRWLLVDVTLAVAFAVIALIELEHEASGIYYVGTPTAGTVIALATAAGFAVRRISPLAVFVGVFGCHVLANLAVPHSLAFFGTMWPLIAMAYTGPRWAPRRWKSWTMAGPVLFVATFWVHTPEARQVDDFAGISLMLLAPWFVGRVISKLVEQAHALDRALADVSTLERQRREQSLLEERTRIAREMHDVVAHGVSVMVVQAGSARLDLEHDLEASRTSLLAIERSGRDVLGELRRTVGLLRAGVDDDVSAPAPDLADIPALVESMRRAGLRIKLELPPDLTTDAGRGLTAYRVVQEALTNVLRHAGPTSVTVQVTAEPDLVVEVRDSGRAPSGRSAAAAAGGGHGLAGMRERIAMYGGRLRAANGEDGFTVRAEIPAEVRS